MSQSGYTPIQLYYSATAAATPSAGNLAAGELAVNITDGKLFYKDSSGVVQVLATKAGALGDVVGPASATDNALARFDTTTGKLIQNSVGVLSDAGVLTGLTGLTSSGNVTLSALTSGRVPYASTGGLLTDSANLLFDGTTLTANALTVSNAVTLSGGTANGVAYLNGSKVLTSGSALTFNGTSLSLNTGGSFVGDTYTNYGTNLVINAGGSLPMIFQLNAAEQMRLNSTGLGIGTSSPAAKLHVQTNNSTQIYLTGGAVGAGSQRATITFNDSGANSLTISNDYVSDSNYTAFNVAGAERLRITGSGNLGLGVTPSAWGSWKAIQVGGYSGYVDVGNGYSFATNNAYGGSTGWKYLNTAAAGLYEQGAGIHAWYTAPSGTAGNAISFTQAMTLDASGRLLVGATSTLGYAEKLGIVGTIAQQGTQFNIVSGTSTQYEFVNRSASAGFDFYVNAGSNLATRIDSSGNLLVGTTSVPYSLTNGRISAGNTGAGFYAATFYTITTDTSVLVGFGNPNGLVGSIQTSAVATIYGTSSDYRLKENIQPMTGALAKVAALKPVTYTWKVDGSAGEGFIAHELAEVCPAAVTGEKDAVDANGNPQYQGIDVSFLVGTLTAAIQELKAEFDAYKASHP